MKQFIAADIASGRKYDSVECKYLHEYLQANILMYHRYAHYM